MSRKAGATYVAIDPQKASEIIERSTNLTHKQIGLCLGYTETWFSNAVKMNQRLATQDIERMKEALNIDLSGAIVSELRKEEVEAGDITPADITRLVEALDRVTASIEHLEQVRSDDTDRIVNMFTYMVEKMEGMFR